MEHTLISVIIPVYNAEKYLDECIEAVVNQTYQDLEIILLPGGSVDHSTEICEKWKQKDPRIIITSQDTNCTGYARNKGISISHGEYIAFCDADDKMLPTFIEDMVNCATDNNSDIVECEYYNASEDLSKLDPYTVLSQLSDLPHSLYERFGSTSVWKYIVRKEYWTNNGFRFPEVSRMEDMAIYSLLFSKTTAISHVYKPLYAYRQNPNSVMHNMSDVDKIIDNFLVISDFIVSEHTRLGTFEDAKATILSQLEHHANYILTDYSELSTEARQKWEKTISDKLFSLFGCDITAFEAKAFGWGSKGTGLLCSLLTMQGASGGRFISQMTLRGMTSENIASQLKALVSEYAPNVIVLDLLEETDYILKYDGDLGEYLKQWAIGTRSLSDVVKEIVPSAKFFIAEKYLATQYLSEGQLYEYQEKNDIETINELLSMMYKSLQEIIPDSTFISAVQESSGYSISNDPKDTRELIEAYYAEKIMDSLHFPG